MAWLSEVGGYGAWGAIAAVLSFLAATVWEAWRPPLRQRSGLGSALALAMILGATVATVVAGPSEFKFSPLRLGDYALSLGVRVDALSLAFAWTVTVVGLVIMRYAARQLNQDQGGQRFFVFGYLTLAAVVAMAFSADLATFVLAWFVASLGLHGLLTLYPGRAAAVEAARLKFRISRLGDVFLVSAMVLLVTAVGTLDFESLATVSASGAAGTKVQWATGLLVLGAMIKSAQVPFNSWLPEAIETPTPVSALMHAGIVNAGGLLVLKSWGLLSGSAIAHQVAVTMGLLSIVVAGLAMMATPDAKRQLAHSTTSQMAFMFVQAGLGHPGAALAHMIGHAFYKAYAVLNSGELPRRRLSPDVGRASHISHAWLTGIVAVLPLGLVASGIPADQAASWALLGIAALGARWQLTVFRPAQVALALAAGLAAIIGVDALGKALLVHSENGAAYAGTGLGLIVAPIFAVVALLGVVFPRLPVKVRIPLLAHSRNGFYLGSAVSRALLGSTRRGGPDHA